LAQKGHPHEVINASVSGNTTSNGRSRLPETLERHDPAIVIIQLGGNDGLRGLAPAAMRDNLAAMIEQARGADARVLLAGIRLPPNYGKAYIERFRRVYREIANSYDIAFVPKILDGVGKRDEWMQADGIHPNAAGQARILDNVWPELTPLLESTG
jgi:acyl-CoA thioesterase-1